MDSLQFVVPDRSSPRWSVYAELLEQNGTVAPGGTAAAMPVCDMDPKCISFRPEYMYLYALSTNTSIDTYYSTKRCGLGLAAPSYVNASCGFANTRYMSCGGASFEVVALNHYALPPALCASTCDQDTRCTVFVATKDLQHCETYSWYFPTATSFLKVGGTQGSNTE